MPPKGAGTPARLALAEAARLELARREQIERDAARDELALSELAPFMRRSWPILDPRPLVWNWHYDLLCEELARVVSGEVRELVICVPPGTGKSITVEAVTLAFLWLQRPAERVLVTSANPRPITKYAIATRNLIKSTWYRGRVAELARRDGRGLVADADGNLVPWRIRPDQDEKINYENTAGGGRISAPIGGAITGDRVEGIIVDDPYDAKSALIGTPTQVADRMSEIVTVYDDVLASRIDPLTGWRIVIMQRLHEGDLAGVLIRRGVRCVVLDMEFDPEAATWRHPRDPRRNPGELLFPRRFTPAWWAETKAVPGAARKVASQYQQRPTPAGGSLFLRAWLTREDRRYQGDPQRFARQLREIAISVDCTFRDGKKSDFVVIQVWGRDGANKYLLDQVRARMDLPATIDALKSTAAKWPQARTKLVEARANGDGVIAMLRGKVPGVIGYDPTASKYGRAQTAAIAFEAGEVYLPTIEHAPWIGDYVEEFAAFPNGGNDDQVDATSQLFIRWDGPDGADAIERTRTQFGFLGKK